MPRDAIQDAQRDATTAELLAELRRGDGFNAAGNQHFQRLRSKLAEVQTSITNNEGIYDAADLTRYQLEAKKELGRMIAMLLDFEDIAEGSLSATINGTDITTLNLNAGY